MDISLPVDTINAQKVCKHLDAYYQGYEGKSFDIGFLKTAFYPNSSVIEKTAVKCWDDRVQTPQHVVSCCFNLAGLQDKRNPAEKPSWHDCLREIAGRSVMAYADEGEEKTAALCALNILDTLKKEEGDFSFNLKACVDQAWTQTKAAYRTS